MEILKGKEESRERGKRAKRGGRDGTGIREVFKKEE